MVRIINICSGKGGVGKTVVTANLGIALQKFHKKVAIADLNLTTSHLGLCFDMQYNNATLNNFLRNEARIEDIMYTHQSGLVVIPASLRMEDIVNVDANNLRNTLKQVFNDYDFILLDSAPGLGKEALLSLKASDEVLFVANPQIPSLVDIEKCKHVINMMENRPVPIGVIINRVKGKSYEIKSDEIRSFLEMAVIGTIPEDENLLASFNRKTLVTYPDKKSPSSKAFFRIAARIAGEKYDYGFWDRLKSIFRNKEQ
jgi:septum site-determining protein MinD